MLPLSHSGGSNPTRVIEAPIVNYYWQSSSIHTLASLTDESPCKAGFVDLHPGSVDISRIAEVGQPHVLDVQVVKCLTDVVEVLPEITREATYFVY